MTHYLLPGGIAYQQRIYPNPADLNTSTGLKTYEDVIVHFTKSSLAEDGIATVGNQVQVSAGPDGYTVSFEPQPQFATRAAQFAWMHVAMLDANHTGLALVGADACALTPAWNPMAGYPVNRSGGPSRWIPCMPLGMPIANHRAVTLLHYPPIVALQNADYLNNMTLRRWALLLTCVGIAQPTLYHAIIDVNPIAAPGSGESEYPNDYFPINLTSLFLDNESLGLTYVRSMLELMLNPPANAANPYTLPLLVGGSPLYDPQAPGWFRTRYKDQLPKDDNGSPTANVLQAGFVKLNPGSPKKTPYMIANHMIAAGVTGVCTGDQSKTPYIQVYEAQDIAAATFLSLYAAQPGIDPAGAARQACQRWFGNATGAGPVNPASKDDQLTICAPAQMDLCFDKVKIAPMYTFAEAKARCQQKGGASYSPCFGCAPVSSAS